MRGNPAIEKLKIALQSEQLSAVGMIAVFKQANSNSQVGPLVA